MLLFFHKPCALTTNSMNRWLSTQPTTTVATMLSKMQYLKTSLNEGHGGCALRALDYAFGSKCQRFTTNTTMWIK